MLISFAVTAKLICTFVFAYADCWLSHGAAHILFKQIDVLPSKMFLTRPEEDELFYYKLSFINCSENTKLRTVCGTCVHVCKTTELEYLVCLSLMEADQRSTHASGTFLYDDLVTKIFSCHLSKNSILSVNVEIKCALSTGNLLKTSFSGDLAGVDDCQDIA